ncbi:MAG TPA: hypothetical protein VGM39_05355 [Kofleriaceae bacterium]
MSRDPHDLGPRDLRARARLHSGPAMWTLVGALSAAISAALIGAIVALAAC